MLNKFIKAFTLVEMLVALAVSSIIIIASYASYEMVATQYKKNMDIADMHTSGRAIMRIIERDIRMAGFEYRDTDAKVTYGTISNPLTIKDSGNKCCDEVTVIYDYFDEESKKAERIRIRYWAGLHTSNKGSRHRLYKQKDILGQNKTILAKPKLGTKDVMADYIEDLQFYQDTGLDQSQTAYDGGTGARTIDNKSYYQTFTSGKTGILSRINMGFFATCCPYKTWSGTALLRIYKGEGVRGNLLSSSTVSAITNAERITMNSWNVSVPVVAGQKYTFDFKPIKGVPDPFGIAIGDHRYTNKYLDGFMNECYWFAGKQYCYQKWPSPKGPMFDMVFQTYVGNGNALVEVNLTLRTKNQYGKDRQFKKKDYHGGNFKIDKTDKYKRDTFSSTVLVRNLAL
jgi:prepilin-type N-terminal cleavage/methylation domain-containing protein